MLSLLGLGFACLVNGAKYEEQVRLIQDADGDGFNVLAGDCDDTLAEVYPSAQEVCDDVDNDCDGLVDDDDDSIAFRAAYQDLDGDGYGAVELAPSCESELSGSSEGGDCDDSDLNVHPGAEEVCANGIDENCDGSSEGCALEGALTIEDHISWRFEFGEEAYIRSVEQKYGVDVNQDGVHDVIFQEERADNHTLYITAISSDLSSPEEYEPIFRIEHPADTNQLNYITYSNNINFVDTPAILIPLKEEIVLFEMPLIGEYNYNERDRSVSLDNIISENPLRFNNIGDTTNDGIDDVVISLNNSSEDLAGYIMSSDILAYDSVSDAVPIYTDATVGALVTIISAGDLNADGVDDAAFSFPGSSTHHSYGGEVGVLYGPIGEDALSLQDADVVVHGSQPQEGLGLLGLTCIGDVNGDGFVELMIGSPLYNSEDLSGSGRVVIFDSSTLADGDVEDMGISTILGDTNLGRSGLASDTQCGGDFDGDSLHDIALGSAKTAATGAAIGTIALFYGPVSGTMDISAADATFASGSDESLFSAGIYKRSSADGLGELFTYGSHEDDEYVNFVQAVQGQGL